jgi:hypothetical protein
MAQASKAPLPCVAVAVIDAVVDVTMCSEKFPFVVRPFPDAPSGVQPVPWLLAAAPTLDIKYPSPISVEEASVPVAPLLIAVPVVPPASTALSKDGVVMPVISQHTISVKLPGVAEK